MEFLNIDGELDQGLFITGSIFYDHFLIFLSDKELELTLIIEEVLSCSGYK